MACIPKDNASSVCPLRSGASVRNQMSHRYGTEKPWTFDAAVSAAVHLFDLRVNAWSLWQNWLDRHPQVNAVDISTLHDDDVLPTREQFCDHWNCTPRVNEPEGFTVPAKDVTESLNAASRSLTTLTYFEVAGENLTSLYTTLTSKRLSRDMLSRARSTGSNSTSPRLRW